MKWKQEPVPLGRGYKGGERGIRRLSGGNESSAVARTYSKKPGDNVGQVDLQKMVDWLNAHAHAKSVGKCAKYVRQGIEAGGGDTSGHAVSAKNWGPTLERIGFKPIPESNYSPKLGDIAVFQPKNKKGHGHIQVYDGTRWVSDYFQPRFRPNRRETTPYQIYRQPQQSVKEQEVTP